MFQSIRKVDHSQALLVAYILYSFINSSSQITNALAILGLIGYCVFRQWLYEFRIKPIEETQKKQLLELHNRLSKLENRENLGKFAEQQRPQRIF